MPLESLTRIALSVIFCNVQSAMTIEAKHPICDIQARREPTACLRKYARACVRACVRASHDTQRARMSDAWPADRGPDVLCFPERFVEFLEGQLVRVRT